CIGDSVICNKHGENKIMEGATNSIINKKAIALDGHHCACGCIGDSVICNKHGENKIMEGATNSIINKKAIAL
ncbi:PAAR domain-containing protein, partial [Shigella sp. FC1967]|uniref:PAAR domain-containing protein n=1 Tax=Shigella sp. FC1967 TaxID=1898041 RepID=UPI001493DDFE